MPKLLEDVLRELSPEELRQFKLQLPQRIKELSPQDRNTALERLRRLPEFAGLLPVPPPQVQTLGQMVKQRQAGAMPWLAPPPSEAIRRAPPAVPSLGELLSQAGGWLAAPGGDWLTRQREVLAKAEQITGLGRMIEPGMLPSPQLRQLIEEQTRPREPVAPVPRWAGGLEVATAPIRAPLKPLEPLMEEYQEKISEPIAATAYSMARGRFPGQGLEEAIQSYREEVMPLGKLGMEIILDPLWLPFLKPARAALSGTVAAAAPGIKTTIRKVTPTAKRLAVEEAGFARLPKKAPISIKQVKTDLKNELWRRAKANEKLPVGVQGTEKSISAYTEGKSEHFLRDWHNTIFPEVAPVAPEVRFTAFEKGAPPANPQEMYNWARGALVTDELSQRLTQATTAPRLTAKNRAAALRIIREGEEAHPEWKQAYEAARLAPEARIAPEVTREPWQMTKQQYVAADPRTRQFRFQVEGTSGEARERASKQWDIAFGDAERVHKQAVADAIREGKPVPPEVLKDYPDLAAKAPAARVAPPEVERAAAPKITLEELITDEQYIKGIVKQLEGASTDKIASFFARQIMAGDNILERIIRRYSLSTDSIRLYNQLVKMTKKGMPEAALPKAPVIPEVTQIEAMARWQKMSPVERQQIALRAKMPSTLAIRDWQNLTLFEKDAITNAMPRITDRLISKAPAARAAPLAPVAKEPWQMTFEESLDKRLAFDKKVGVPQGDSYRIAAAFHKSEVERALAEGKPVPPEVLADYPDLAKTIPKPPVTGIPPTEGIPPAKPPVGLPPIGDYFERLRFGTLVGYQPPGKPPFITHPRLAKEPLALPPGKLITKVINIAEEKVRLAQPGAITKAFDDFPLTRPGWRLFDPAKALTKDQHISWVAKSAALSHYQTLAYADRVAAFQALDKAFSPAFTTGEAMPLKYIGPAGRAKSPQIGKAIDVIRNPDHYVLSAAQREAIKVVRAYQDKFLGIAVNEYGAKIGHFPTKEGAAFVQNVDASEFALEVYGNSYTAARVGRAKPRVWEDAVARQMHDPSFNPQTNLKILFTASDEAKATMVASEVFKARLGGLTKLEVLEKTHPALYKKMSALKQRLQSIKAAISRLDEKQAAAIDDFLTSPYQDMDLADLHISLDPKIGRAVFKTPEGNWVTMKPGVNYGKTVKTLEAEMGGVIKQIKALSPSWKVAYTKPYVLVQKGVYRYFPIEEAKSLEQLLEVSRNPALSLAWEIRNIAFNLDLSPLTGVHLPLAFVSDSLGASRQFVKLASTAEGQRQLARSMSPSALAENIRNNPTSWAEFAAVSGKPIGQTAEEFAGGILRRIPGYSKLNEGMFTAVTNLLKGSYDDLVRGAEKTGIPHNEAIISASETVHKVVPLIDPALLGQSQARAKLLQSLTISPSFLIRPVQFQAEVAKALIKAGLKQPLTTKEKMVLRVALTMFGTITTISVASAVIDALAHKKDPAKVALQGLTDMSLHLLDGRKIPLGGPHRSLIMAMRPKWINKEMDYMMPFAGVPNWGLGRITPAIRTQYDLVRNKDFFNNRIMTGEFPVNILEAIRYEFEGTIPLSLSAWVEGWRTGAPLEKTAEQAAVQALGTSLYERPGPWALRGEWREELRRFYAIPTEPVEIKALQLKGGLSRTQYRERNPEIDAKLFVVGDVESLLTNAAKTRVRQLIQEKNIDPEKIRGIRSQQETEKKRLKEGLPPQINTPTGRLVFQLPVDESKLKPNEIELRRIAQSALPYFEIEEQVWAKYPPNLKLVSDLILQIAQRDESKAKKLLYNLPSPYGGQIIYARKEVVYQKKVFRYQNPEIDKLLDTYYR